KPNSIEGRFCWFAKSGRLNYTAPATCHGHALDPQKQGGTPLLPLARYGPLEPPSAPAIRPMGDRRRRAGFSRVCLPALSVESGPLVPAADPAARDSQARPPAILPPGP